MKPNPLLLLNHLTTPFAMFTISYYASLIEFYPGILHGWLKHTVFRAPCQADIYVWLDGIMALTAGAADSIILTAGTRKK
jgi:hypothetical protein